MRGVRTGIVVAALAAMSAAAAWAAVGTQGMSVQGMSVQGMSVQGMSVQGMSVQGMSVQGMSVQGMSVQGMSVQGMSVQGMSVQGMSVQGMSVQGMSVQGMSVQGMSVQGMSVQGTSVQGMSVQGMSVQGVTLPGLDPDGLDPQGLDPVTLDPLVEAPAAIDPANVVLQAGPGDTANGNFISLPGRADATGTFWRLDVQNDAGDWVGGIPLFVAGVERDRQTNLSTFPSNDDVWLYTVYYRTLGTGAWTALCPDDVHGKPHALAVPGSNGDRHKFTFACTATGVAAKCARIWGYKWWKSVPERVWNGTDYATQNVDLAPFWRACVTAARADYCQDGHSFTRDGTLVDLYDSLDGRSSIQGSAGWAFDPGQPGVMMHEEYQLSVGKTVADLLGPSAVMSLPPADQALVEQLQASGLKSSRYADLDPGRACAAAPWIDRCAPAEPRACFASNTTAATSQSYGALLAVNSSRYCSHPEDQTGDALDPLCNACVSRVCAVDPTCCGDRQGGFYPGSVVWGQHCVDLRNQVCKTSANGPVWPAGQSAPPAAGAPRVSRSGSVGAVVGLDAAGDVEGWACDPDAPDAPVRVRVTVGAPTAEATVTSSAADLPLAPAWRAAAASACGGGASARHGFTITPPAGSAGQDLFVYALDTSAPSAPAALIGRARVPACAHGEYAPGAALPASCSACAASVCATMPSCCAGSWTSACVAQAATACAATSCAHAETQAGAALASRCSVCAANVCSLRPSCCTGAWDDACVQLAATACDSPTAPASTCAHDERLPGDKLPASCSACAARVCAGAPACCARSWTPICAAAALTTCAPASCAHAETAVGAALRAHCSACVDEICALDATCCSSAWSAACASAAAARCASPSAPATPHRFDALWMGWLEAPSDGTYGFSVDAAGRALVVVNGQTVAASAWPGAPPVPPTLSLLRGVKVPVGVYYLADDGPSHAAISWTLPDASGPVLIDTQWLYAVGAPVGNGLDATYFDAADLTGATLQQKDATLDFLWQTPPVGPAGDFSARWTGQLSAPMSDSYTIYAKTDGLVKVTVGGVVALDNTNVAPVDPNLCAHSVCSVGGPMNRACPQASFCADRVCATDPFCCYNTWDSRCIGLVKAACSLDCAAQVTTPVTLAAGVRTDLSVEYHHAAGAGELHLYWVGARQGRELIPARALFSSAGAAAGLGAGLTTVVYDDLDGHGAERPGFSTQGPLGGDWGAGAPDWPSAAGLVCGQPGAAACDAASAALGAPALSAPIDGAHVTQGASLAIAGQASRGAAVSLTSDGAVVGSTTASAADGSFSQSVTLPQGTHALRAIQSNGGATSAPSPSVAVTIDAPTDPTLPAPPVVTSPPDGQAGAAAQIVVAGAALANAAVIVNVDGGDLPALSTDPSGVFTGSVTLSGYGWHALRFATDVGGKRSAYTSPRQVGLRPPRITVTAPVDGATSATPTIAFAGVGVAGLGAVTIADGSGTYFATVAQAPTAADGSFAGSVALDVGAHLLKFFQMTPDGLGSDAVAIAVGVSPGATPVMTSPADGTIVDSPARVQGTATAAPLGGAATIYDGTVSVGQVKLVPTTGAATFDGTIALAAGWQTLTATQWLPSLSGAGSIESAPSASVKVGVRPAPPVITAPLNGRTAEGTTTLTVAGQSLPGVTVTLASNATTVARFTADANGAWGGTATLPNGSQYLTALQTFAGIDSRPSTAVYVAVGDIRPPALTVPANIKAAADHAGGAIVTFTVTAKDLRDGPVTPTCAPNSGSLFALGTTTVYCTATDAAGNAGTGSFTVFVHDPTPPVVVPPAGLTLEATGPQGAVGTFQADATGSVGDCAGNGTASCPAWKNIGRGITCGVLNSVAASPTEPGKAYAAGFRSLFISSDSGQSWTSLPAIVQPTGGFFMSPQGELYVIDYRGLFKSADGSDWMLIKSGSVSAITFPTTSPGVVYAGIELGNVIRTTDNGQTWISVTNNLPAGQGQSISALAVDPNNSSRIFASYLNGTLFRSNDGGLGWQQIDVPSFFQASFIQVSPNDSNLIFASRAISRDGGATWTSVQPGGSNYLQSVGFTPADPTAVYAAFTYGTGSLYRSTDGAETWTAVGASTGIRGFAFDPASKVIYAASNGGLFLSRDGGQKWAPPASGLVSDSCAGTSIALSPSDPRVIYAGFTSGLYKSGNGGDDWTLLKLGSFSDAKIDPTNTNVVWAGVGGSLIKSSDGGQTWTILDPGAGFISLAIVPTTPSFIYVAADDGVRRSDDSGATWQSSNTGLPTSPMAVAIATDPTVLSNVFTIIRGAGTYRSRDRGANWELIGQTADWRVTGGSIAVDSRTSPSVIYVRQTSFITGGPNQIFRSDDGGTTFTAVPFTTSCPNYYTGACAYLGDPLVVDSFASTPRLFLGSVSGLTSSTDSANSFSLFASTPFTPGAINVSPSDGTIFTTINEATGSTFGNVVGWRSTNAGDAPPTAGLLKGDIRPSCVPATGSLFPIGDTAVTCTATDALGQATARTFNVHVGDTAPPVLTVPADIKVDAGGSATMAVTFAASAQDAVDGAVAPMCAPASGSDFPLGDTIVLCAATDAAGNGATKSFKVTVGDVTPPTLVAPSAVDVEATSAAGAVVTFVVSATDASGPVAVTCAPASGTTFAIGSVPVVCAASDSAGNRGSATFVVTVHDATGPTVTVPASFTTEATAPTGAAVTFVATAVDAVDGAVPPSCTPGSGSTFPVGTTTVSCGAQDRAGNAAALATFTVTVVDTQAPTLTLPPNQLAEAQGPFGARVAYSPSAADAVGVVSLECAPASPVDAPALFALGSTDVVCTATDGAGHLANGTFTVTVVDTTAPQVFVPRDLVLEAAGPAGAAVTFAVSASDVVDGTVAAACHVTRAGGAAPFASGGTLPLGLTTVTCEASDAVGNLGGATFSVLVRDSAPPSLVLPAPVVDASDPNGAVVSFAARATDAVSGAVPVQCTPASGAPFPVGVTPVSCVATDAAGNQARGTFNVTVRPNTAPVVTVPADFAVEATGSAGAVVTYSASATDAEDGPLAVHCLPASGGGFPLSATSVTCTATDKGGLTTSRSFVVTVRDTTAPVISPPPAPVAEATGPGGAVVTFALTANDAVGGARPVTCAPASGSLFALGGTLVSCAATDAAGNHAAVSFTVTVVDTTPPALSLPPRIVVGASGPTAVVTFTASAVDLVAGAVPVSCSPASGQAFPVGTTTVACAAVDGVGNRAAGTFVVTVNATNTPPVVTVPAPVTAEATSAAGAKVTYAATARDAEDGTLVPQCSPASGATFALGATTVTCTATDRGGLSGTARFTVTVRDTTGPVLAKVPGPLAAFATSTSGARVIYTAPSANDAVDGARPVSCTPASGAQFPVGKSTVSCTASDSHSNASVVTFSVSVTYQTPTDGTFFLAPIRSDGSSVFQIGRPVPVKFQLMGVSKGITNLVAHLSITKISNAIKGSVATTSDETVADTGLTFQYRAGTHLYAYRWKTMNQTQGTYQLDVSLGDSVIHRITISLRAL